MHLQDDSCIAAVLTQLAPPGTNFKYAARMVEQNSAEGKGEANYDGVCCSKWKSKVRDTASHCRAATQKVTRGIHFNQDTDL